MPAVELSDGNGGLRKITLRHSGGASAEIYLWGATLTSYKSAAGKEHIFMSPGAIWDGKKAIRGGVPVVFPQFGQPDKAMPQHGFVRTSMWGIKGFHDSGDAVCATLSIKDSEETRAKWPHAFSLDYLVRLTATGLEMSLRVTNTGPAAFDFQALLHTYLNVTDIGGVRISGLKGMSYIDKVAGGETKTEDRDEVSLPSFTDSVYVGTVAAPKEAIVSEGGALAYTVVNVAMLLSGGPQAPNVSTPVDVVVWNPYEGASPGDLPPPAFKNFVCVEPGLVSKMTSLGPTRSAVVSQVIVPAAP